MRPRSPSTTAPTEARTPTLLHAIKVIDELHEVLVGVVPSTQADPSERRPTVAVVVPAYGAAEHLEDCLESVRRQTYADWRCYVVDDASVDGSAELAARFARSDQRFTLLRHGRNAGLSASRNTGLLAATEELVTFLDADDLLVPTSIERRIDAFLAHEHEPDVVGAWGSTPQVPEETSLAEARSFDRSRDDADVHVLSRDGECPFNAHAPLLRAELLRRLGGFDERLLSGAEDWDLWQRLLSHGYRIVHAGGLAGLYRQRSGSMVRRDPSGHLDISSKLISRAHADVMVDADLAADPVAGRSLSCLMEAASLANRTAIYLGIHVASTGDPSVIDDPSWVRRCRRLPASVLRGRNLRSQVESGLRRGLGLGVSWNRLPSESQERIGAVAEVIADRLIAQISLLPIEQHETTDDLRPVRVRTEIAFLASTAADVEAFAVLVERLRSEGQSVVALDVERLGGAQGAAAAWAAMSMPVEPWGDLAMGRVVADCVVARRPFGPVVVDALERLSATGSRTVEWRSDDPDTRLECDPSDAVTVDDVWTPEGAVRSDGFSGPAVPLRLDGLVVEEGAQHEASLDLLTDLRDRHRGEACVIIGNGPSLNETDLSVLSSVPTFGVNGIFYADERLPKPVTYYVVEDTSVFRENTERIKAYKTGHKFFPTNYLVDFAQDEIEDRMAFFRMNAGFYDRKTGTRCHPRFSFDPRQRLYCGQSVTIINLQLAHWMGFDRVVLIGMDFSYTIPDDVDRRGDLLTSNSDDVNHFHADYFGKGKTWKDPKLDRVLVNYHLAREIYRATGREIVNATVGGQLKSFRRLDLAEAVRV